MLDQQPPRHYLHRNLTQGRINVVLVGCGGNGGQMLMGLASLETALQSLTNRRLHVTTIDDDVVTEANLGRQPFYACDLGRSKAYTLTERINLAHGLQWHAIHGRAPRDLTYRNTHLVISCVDTAAARRDLHTWINAHSVEYWLDLGNRATDGQYVLGTPCPSHDQAPALPTVMDMFPELADDTIPENDQPSCSLAEALEKQSLFVNRALASHALDLLFNLLCRGSISHAGGFMNLATGHMAPIGLPKPDHITLQAAA